MMVWPRIMAESGVHKNATTRATSWGSTMRPAGVRRTDTMREFVAWVRAVPTNRDMPVLDGLFKFLGERYPCKQ